MYEIFDISAGQRSYLVGIIPREDIKGIARIGYTDNFYGLIYHSISGCHNSSVCKHIRISGSRI